MVSLSGTQWRCQIWRISGVVYYRSSLDYKVYSHSKLHKYTCITIQLAISYYGSLKAAFKKRYTPKSSHVIFFLFLAFLSACFYCRFTNEIYDCPFGIFWFLHFFSFLAIFSFFCSLPLFLLNGPWTPCSAWNERQLRAIRHFATGHVTRRDPPVAFFTYGDLRLLDKQTVSCSPRRN